MVRALKIIAKNNRWLKKFFDKNLTPWMFPSVVDKALKIKSFPEDKDIAGLMRRWTSSEVDALIFMLEYYWAEGKGDFKNRNVIFPQTKHLVEIIKRSKFRNVDITTLPETSFILAMPKELGLPSCFVNLVNQENFERSMLALYTSWNKDYTPSGITLKSFFTVSICLPYIAHGQKTYEYVHSSLTGDGLQTLLEFSDINNKQKLIDLLPGDNIVGSDRLSKTDEYIQALMTKIAANFMLYRLIYKNKIVDGVPQNIVAQSRQTLGKLIASPEYAENDPQNDILQPVAVGIHDRQLRHPRYYRTPEWKDKPLGSRWISVKAHNRRGHAETIR